MNAGTGWDGVRVGSFTACFTQSLTLDDDYSAGYALGAAIELPRAAREPGLAAVLQSLTLVSWADVASSLDVFFFSEDPELSSNAAFTLSDAALAALQGCVPVAAEDWLELSDETNRHVACLRNLGLVIQPAQSLYVGLRTNDGGAYTTLHCTFGFLRD